MYMFTHIYLEILASFVKRLYFYFILMKIIKFIGISIFFVFASIIMNAQTYLKT